MNDRLRFPPHAGSLALDDSGSAAIEYAILASLITIALVSAISGLSEFLLGGAIYISDELLRITSMLSG